MTLSELEDFVSFKKVGYGTWRVYRVFSRDRYVTGVSHNSFAIDRISSDVSPRTSLYGYTLKQAYLALLSCVDFSRVHVFSR